MRKHLIGCILLLVSFTLQAQKDSLPYYKHTAGINVLMLAKALIPEIYGNKSDLSAELFYRYQLGQYWGVNAGACFRSRSGSMGIETLEKSDGRGYCLRLGPVFNSDMEHTHLSMGVNAIGSFLKDDVYLKIPNTTWGDYEEKYTINRKRVGAEIELGIEGGLYRRIGTRVVIRGGYAPTHTDSDELKGLAFPGIYSWFGSNDYYFYTTLFVFVRAGRNKR
jgi:hypothetical protein